METGVLSTEMPSVYSTLFLLQRINVRQRISNVFLQEKTLSCNNGFLSHPLSSGYFFFFWWDIQ